jgi:hypothetical protein
MLLQACAVLSRKRKIPVLGFMVGPHTRFAVAHWNVLRFTDAHQRLYTRCCDMRYRQLSICLIEAKIEDGLFVLWTSVDTNSEHIDRTLMHQRDCGAHIDSAVHLYQVELCTLLIISGAIKDFICAYNLTKDAALPG